MHFIPGVYVHHKGHIKDEILESVITLETDRLPLLSMIKNLIRLCLDVIWSD